MYVCHCRAVTDRTVRATIIAGASTVEEVGRRCGAGTECHACHPELERLLAERAARLARPMPMTGTDGRHG